MNRPHLLCLRTTCDSHDDEPTWSRPAPERVSVPTAHLWQLGRAA